MKNTANLSSIALLTALCAGVTGCIAAAPDEPVSGEIPSEDAKAASDGKSSAAVFLDTSTMRGDQGDWDVCHGKASCAPGETVRGLSRIPGGPGRTALCTPADGAYSGQVNAVINLDGRSDVRRAERVVNGSKDWAPGKYKLECGAGEYVAGVSEDASQCSGSNAFHALQCAQGAGLQTDGCSVRAFGGGDDRGESASGDWDDGAFKGECREGEHVAGVSVDPGSMAPDALLCCPSGAVSGGGGGVTEGDPFYGLSIDHESWGADQAQTMRALGAGLARIQFCDWPNSRASLESAVNAARAAGLQVLAELNYCTVPGWSTSAQWHAGFSDAGNEFSGIFTATAEDIARTFQGKVRFYEIWNEPNAAPRPNNWPAAQWPDANNANWDGACTDYAYGADYGQSAWALCPKQLGVITTNAFMAIKGADPGAKIVAGNVLYHGDDGWVAKEYWKQVEKSPAVNWHMTEKGKKPWDYVGIHPYAYRPTDGTLRAQIQSFQAILAQNGDPAQTVLSEYGWTTDPNGDQYHRATDDEQAQFLKATFQVAKELNLGFVSWFNYLDGGGIAYGMRRPDMSWKASGRAFCEAAGATATCPAP